MLRLRSYREETDKLSIARLAQQFGQDHLHSIDLPYRLSSWALDDPHNVCLLEDGSGSLVAWAIMQTPFWSLDLALHPEYASLFPALLEWADARARELLGTPFGLPSWYVNVFSDQVVRIDQLKKAGFACQSDLGEDSWSKIWLKRPGNTPVKDFPISSRFTIRSLADEHEAAEYVELHRTVFGSENMTVEWRLRTLQHPHYAPDLDVVISTPDGKLAAFCIAWLCQDQDQPGKLTAQIEPLGCHPDYRRYALGRLALAEVLRRIQSHDVQDIYVETDSYLDTAFLLYESMGFAVHRDVLVFRKDYA